MYIYIYIFYMEDCIISPGFKSKPFSHKLKEENFQLFHSFHGPGRILREHFHAQSSMLMHPEAAFVRSTWTTPATKKKIQ